MLENLKGFVRLLRGSPRNKKHEILKYVFPAIKSWKIEGEFFEFGVFEGRTTLEANRMANKVKREILYFAFDSFEGLPESEENGNKFHQGQYSCSEEKYLNKIQSGGIKKDKIRTFKGFYDVTLNNNLQAELTKYKAAVVWIDCDLYISTVPVLNFILPFLQNGTIICFDDWFSFGGNPLKGELRATEEWLLKNDNIKLLHYKDFGVSGRSFIVQIH